MARPRTPKIAKLLNALKKTPMTHKKMVKFLLYQAGISYDETSRKYFDSTLYGTVDKRGVLERFCQQRTDGTYTVAKRTNVDGPFTQVWWKDAGYTSNPNAPSAQTAY